MDDPTDRQAVARRDAFLRELERKSLDTIMVYNPTDKDYFLEWDKRYHRIPARTKDIGFGKGRMELSRYLAEKYAREMKNILINLQADEFLKGFREDREKKGQRFRDKFEENNEALPLVPKTSDAELIKEIYGKIILGVVKEYGLEMPEELSPEKYDDKTPEEKILENMNKPFEETSTPEVDVPVVEQPVVMPQKGHPPKEKIRSAVSEVSK